MERCKWHASKASKMSVYFNCALLIYFNAILLATVEQSSWSRKFKNMCIILCKVMWGQFTRSVTVPAKLIIATMLNFDGDFHEGGNATCRDQRLFFSPWNTTQEQGIQWNVHLAAFILSFQAIFMCTIFKVHMISTLSLIEIILGVKKDPSATDAQCKWALRDLFFSK